MIIWVLSRGEDNEGGNVLGVYSSKTAAFADFVATALEMSRGEGKPEVTRHPDGSARFRFGCDWLDLDPHELRDNTRLTPAEGDLGQLVALLGQDAIEG